MSPYNLQTNTALIYDGVMILAEALKQIGYAHLELDLMEKISCYNTQSAWSKGYTLTNFMKSVGLPSDLLPFIREYFITDMNSSHSNI